MQDRCSAYSIEIYSYLLLLPHFLSLNPVADLPAVGLVAALLEGEV
jgi:hypothetical protein